MAPMDQQNENGTATENGTTNEDVIMSKDGTTGENAEEIAARVRNELKVPDGVQVIPPPSIRNVIEKTAEPVSRVGISMEEKIKTARANEARFKFLVDTHPYHAYYLWRLEEHRQKRGLPVPDVIFKSKEKPKVKVIEKPSEFEFSARMPPISARDLEVLNQTAQFVTIHGRGFLMGLSQREAGNPQFDFLRPTHSYNQYFTAIVDQYTALLTSRSQKGGQRQQERIAEVTKIVNDKFSFLDKAKARAEWVKSQEKEQQRKEEKERADKEAFASIDWQAFEVAETLTFPEGENISDFALPTTIGQLQALSLTQRAAISVSADRLLEETLPGTEFDTAPPAQYQPAPAQPAQSAHIPPQPVRTYSPAPVQAYPLPPGPFSPPPALATAHGLPTRPSSSAPAQVAPGAGPRARRRGPQVPMVPCPNCGQQIPSDEFEAHIRIELQDPKWREQKAKAEERFSATNLRPVDVANNLKRLASQREDIFDPVTGEPISEEELARRKRVAYMSTIVQAPDQDDVGRTVKMPMVRGLARTVNSLLPPQLLKTMGRLHLDL